MQVNKLCLIIPSLRHGGAERVISILANHWAQDKNLQVSLIVLTNQLKYYSLDKRVTLIEPKRSYKKNAFSKLMYSFWTLKYIRQTVKQIKPDAVLSFCERYNNLVLLSLTNLQFPIFVSDRNNPSNSIGLIHEKLRKILYKKANGIIAQTSRGADALFNKTGNSNIVVISNPLREIKQFNVPQEKIILNVGRNEYQKNQLELVDIFAKLTNSHDWKLYIIGNGALREELQLKIQHYKLEDSVILMEFQSDIDLYFQKASVFAFPSLYEGFPNALSEAMANGLPCVAYDCPTGPAEMITDEINGFLVPLKDNIHFLEVLQSLVDSIELRNKLGVEAIKIKDRLAEEKICSNYLNTILNI